MQCGANTVVVVVDVVAIVVDGTVGVDVRGVVCIVTRRPQPPVCPYNRIPALILRFKPPFVTVYPPAQQIHTLARQQRNLFILFGQNALLFHCKHRKICQNLEVRHSRMHEPAAQAHGLAVALLDKCVVCTKQTFEHVERQILQPPCKREPKLLRAFLSHSHDIFAQLFCFDDDREFALFLEVVHWL